MWSLYLSLYHISTMISHYSLQEIHVFLFSSWGTFVYHLYLLITVQLQILSLSMGPAISGGQILSTVSPSMLPSRRLLRFHFSPVCLRHSPSFSEGKLLTHILGSFTVFFRRKKRQLGPSISLFCSSGLLTLDNSFQSGKLSCGLTKLIYDFCPHSLI